MSMDACGNRKHMLIAASDIFFNSKIIQTQHCVKTVGIRSYSGRHFPAFGMNTERYGVSLCIQSECGKIRTRITPNMDTFYAVRNIYFSEQTLFYQIVGGIYSRIPFYLRFHGVCEILS